MITLGELHTEYLGILEHHRKEKGPSRKELHTLQELLHILRKYSLRTFSPDIKLYDSTALQEMLLKEAEALKKEVPAWVVSFLDMDKYLEMILTDWHEVAYKGKTYFIYAAPEGETHGQH